MFLSPCAAEPGKWAFGSWGLTLIEGQGTWTLPTSGPSTWYGGGADHSPWAQGSEHAEGPSESGVSLGLEG